MISLLLIILSILSAFAYRFGGMAKKGNFLDFLRNTRTRDIGCSLLQIIATLSLLGAKMGYIWAYLLVFGLSWGALTIYWDKIQFNKGKDNFWMHGFFCGLALLPLVFCGLAWWIVLIRAVVLALSFGVINTYVNRWGWKNSVDIEEYSRGALLIITIFIFKLF